jgi:hypothetical protein
MFVFRDPVFGHRDGEIDGREHIVLEPVADRVLGMQHQMHFLRLCWWQTLLRRSAELGKARAAAPS